MPFLKVQKTTWCEQRIESSKRNGWRHAIYTPEVKRIVKAHYKGEWRNDKREGKGIGVSRCHKHITSLKFPFCGYLLDLYQYFISSTLFFLYNNH